MTTFKTPVAMKVTKEQFIKDLQEPLLRLGYYLGGNRGEWGELKPYIFTNFGGTAAEMGIRYMKGSISFLRKQQPRIDTKAKFLKHWEGIKPMFSTCMKAVHVPNGLKRRDLQVERGLRSEKLP